MTYDIIRGHVLVGDPNSGQQKLFRADPGNQDICPNLIAYRLRYLTAIMSSSSVRYALFQ